MNLTDDQRLWAALESGDARAVAAELYDECCPDCGERDCWKDHGDENE